MKRVFFYTCIYFLSVLAQACAAPAQVILIRHAEKPAFGNQLALKGRERAAALAPFFMGRPEVLKFGPPFALYAAGVKDEHSSRRSIETLQPLADELRLPIHTEFLPDQYREIAQKIKEDPLYANRMILIAWEHHAIPLLAQALGVHPEPPRWHGEVFDRIWLITYREDGTADFQDLPQKLLFGDSEN